MSWEEFRATRLGAAQNCSATLAGNHRMRADAALPETVSYLNCSSQKILYVTLRFAPKTAGRVGGSHVGTVICNSMSHILTWETGPAWVQFV
jgi:hypothetical protein